jgi:hypothetical protein
MSLPLRPAASSESPIPNRNTKSVQRKPAAVQSVAKQQLIWLEDKIQNRMRQCYMSNHKQAVAIA